MRYNDRLGFTIGVGGMQRGCKPRCIKHARCSTSCPHKAWEVSQIRQTAPKHASTTHWCSTTLYHHPRCPPLLALATPVFTPPVAPAPNNPQAVVPHPAPPSTPTPCVAHRPRPSNPHNPQLPTPKLHPPTPAAPPPACSVSTRPPHSPDLPADYPPRRPLPPPPRPLHCPSEAPPPLPPGPPRRRPRLRPLPGPLHPLLPPGLPLVSRTSGVRGLSGGAQMTGHQTPGGRKGG